MSDHDDDDDDDDDDDHGNGNGNGGGVGINNVAADDKLAHYQANGATSNDLQDAEREFLLVQVPGGLGTNADIWMVFLNAQGYVGALSDRRSAYWAAVFP